MRTTKKTKTKNHVSTSQSDEAFLDFIGVPRLTRAEQAAVASLSGYFMQTLEKHHPYMDDDDYAVLRGMDEEP